MICDDVLSVMELKSKVNLDSLCHIFDFFQGMKQKIGTWIIFEVEMPSTSFSVP